MGASVVPVEQEEREQTPPLPREPCVQTLWSPGTEWALWAHGTERALERAL